MIIPIRCRTNLDDYKHEKWPNMLCCRPELGDKIVADSGVKLTIVSIAHTMNKEYDHLADNKNKPTPILLIELHKRGALP